MIRITGAMSENKKLKVSTSIFDKKYPFKKKITISRNNMFQLFIYSKKKIKYSDYIFENDDVFIFSFDNNFIEKLNKNKNKNLKKLFFNDVSSSIYLEKKKDLYLKRSIFSANTIYFTRNKNNYFFSSEIKILLLNNKKKFTICKKILANFLCRNYRLVFGRGYTFFNNIYEIKTACFIKISSKISKQKQYWLPSLKNKFSTKPFNEFRKSIENAISQQLSKYKKPIFLVSGGLDSTLIASFAKKITKKKVNTISAIFKKSKKFDESFYIKKLNSKIANKSYYIDMSDKFFVRWLERKEKNFDQPLLSPVYLLMNYILFFIEKKKYDSVFGGGGGDILSMGTYEYQPYIFADYLKISKKKYDKEILKWNIKQKKLIRYWPTDNLKMQNLIRKLTGKNGKIYHNPDWVKSNSSVLNLKFFKKKDLTFVPNIKYKFPFYIQSRIADEIFSQAMPTHFIEELNMSEYKLSGSDPFLDKDLIEKCFNLKLKHITSNGYAKVLFRKSSKGILPNIVRLRKERTGLSIPIDDWFVKGPLNKYFKKLLKNSSNKKILNIGFVKKILLEHEKKINDNSWLLWRLISFMIWKKNYNGHIKN